MSKKNLMHIFIVIFFTLFSIMKSIKIDPNDLNWLTFCKDENQLT